MSALGLHAAGQPADTSDCRHDFGDGAADLKDRLADLTQRLGEEDRISA